MKKMKKLLATFVGAALLMGMVAGCSKPVDKPVAGTSADKPAAETPADKPADEKILIPVVSKGFQHQFWQAVKLGAERAAEEYGVEITFEGPETEAQVDKQLDMIQAALTKKPQAMALAALDFKAATQYLEQAEVAGIPIIGFDSGVDSPIVKTTAATDNYAAAVADKMVELIGGKGKVGQ